MNMTTNAGAPVKSANETVFPFVSGRRKSGASAPSGTMVELVSAIGEFETGRAACRMQKGGSLAIGHLLAHTIQHRHESDPAVGFVPPGGLRQSSASNCQCFIFTHNPEGPLVGHAYVFL